MLGRSNGRHKSALISYLQFFSFNLKNLAPKQVLYTSMNFYLSIIILHITTINNLSGCVGQEKLSTSSQHQKKGEKFLSLLKITRILFFFLLRCFTFPNPLRCQKPIPNGCVDWGKYAAQNGFRTDAFLVPFLWSHYRCARNKNALDQLLYYCKNKRFKTKKSEWEGKVTIKCKTKCRVTSQRAAALFFNEPLIKRTDNIFCWQRQTHCF